MHVDPRLRLNSWFDELALEPWTWSHGGRGRGNEAVWAEPSARPPQILTHGWSKLSELWALMFV